MKKPIIEYDNRIKDFEELIDQLDSLRYDAMLNMRNEFHDEVFIKDVHALSIVIRYLEEVKEYETKRTIKGNT